MEPDDIGRIEFRLTSADDERIRRRFHRDDGGLRGWNWVAVTAVAVVCIAAITGSDVSSTGTGAANAWRDPGSAVRGQRVLVVADDSGSMYDQDGAFIRIRDSQVDSLRRQHQIVEQPLLTSGWAIRALNVDLSVVLPIEAAVARQPGLDAIYFISDFARGDNAWDDVEGYALLSRLIRGRGIRLYVASVNEPVPAPFVTLAEESGGAVF